MQLIYTVTNVYTVSLDFGAWVAGNYLITVVCVQGIFAQ